LGAWRTSSEASVSPCLRQSPRQRLWALRRTTRRVAPPSTLGSSLGCPSEVGAWRPREVRRRLGQRLGRLKRRVVAWRKRVSHLRLVRLVRLAREVLRGARSRDCHDCHGAWSCPRALALRRRLLRPQTVAGKVTQAAPRVPPQRLARASHAQRDGTMASATLGCGGSTLGMTLGSGTRTR
jgi:hypothetical protein